MSSLKLILILNLENKPFNYYVNLYFLIEVNYKSQLIKSLTCLNSRFYRAVSLYKPNTVTNGQLSQSQKQVVCIVYLTNNMLNGK